MAYSKVILNGTTLIDLTDDTVTADKLLASYTATKKDGVEVTGIIATKTADNLSANGKTVTVPSGYYASQCTKDVATGSVVPAINSHSVTTTPVVTGSLSGTITNIGTTTKPSGTDGTDYWTITPSGSVTTTGVSTANAKATVTAGYIASSPSNSSNHTVSITPTASAGTSRYIAKGTITNNTSGGTSTATINRGSQIKIGAGYYSSDAYYTAQANSGTLTLSTSSNAQTDISCNGYQNVKVTGIKVPKDKTFSLTSTADTAYDDTSLISITGATYRKFNATLPANSYMRVVSSGSELFLQEDGSTGSITVSATTATTSSQSAVVVENGYWKTTVPTSAGAYYGCCNIEIAADPALKGGNVTLDAGSGIYGNGCTLSDIDTSGVNVGFGVNAIRGSVLFNGPFNGWIAKPDGATLLSADSSASLNSLKYLTGVTLTAPSSGSRTFAVTVPNGSSTATFTFNVASTGTVTITES